MLPVLHSAAFWNFMMYFCMFLGGAVLIGAFLTIIILTAVMAIRAIVSWLSPPLAFTEKAGHKPFYPAPPAPIQYNVNGFSTVELTPPDTPPRSPESPDALEKALEAEKALPAHSQA